jgi:uncharacterized protein
MMHDRTSKNPRRRSARSGFLSCIPHQLSCIVNRLSQIVPPATGIICGWIVLAILFLLPSFTALALDVPPLQGYVNDYAGMMSAPTRSRLTEELGVFEKSDSTQIVILTVPSLQGDTLEDFSIRAAEAWKIGQKGKDNGILFIVANQEHKIRIEVGRGLEGRLTDLLAGRIIDLVIKPRFKRGDFDGGFSAGTHALIDATRGEFKAAADNARPSKGRPHIPILALVIFGGIALVIIGNFSRPLGAVAGALGLPLAAFLFIGSLGLMVLIILGLVGLVLGILLPFFVHGNGMFWPGGWGGPGGGFGGGGDDGGSGFGGGGGDFGGGGASGDW